MRTARVINYNYRKHPECAHYYIWWFRESYYTERIKNIEPSFLKNDNGFIYITDVKY